MVKPEEQMEPGDGAVGPGAGAVEFDPHAQTIAAVATTAMTLRTTKRVRPFRVYKRGLPRL
jgi:hypothetical protein